MTLSKLVDKVMADNPIQTNQILANKSVNYLLGECMKRNGRLNPVLTKRIIVREILISEVLEQWKINHQTSK